MTRAAIMTGVGQPVEIVDCDLADPGEHEVRVEITASGVCRSDLGVLRGVVPAALPMVLGHEACGIVAAVGRAVTRVAVGDQVILGPELQCGTCYFCQREQPELCVLRARAARAGGLADGTPRFRLGTQPVHQFVCAGTFAQETVVSEFSTVPVDHDIPAASAALMSCAVATGFGAATNRADIRPGDTVVVFGCGGVGLSVIQGARYRRAGRIVAVDIIEAKRAAALRFGATDTIDPAADDVVEGVMAMTAGRGADVTFEVIGNPATIRQAWDTTRRGGQATLVGGPPPDATLTLAVQDVVTTERRLQGVSYGGTDLRRDVALWIDLYRAGQLLLDEMVSQTLPLDRVNEAFDAMDRGDVLRTVILP